MVNDFWYRNEYSITFSTVHCNCCLTKDTERTRGFNALFFGQKRFFFPAAGHRNHNIKGLLCKRFSMLVTRITTIRYAGSNHPFTIIISDRLGPCVDIAYGHFRKQVTKRTTRLYQGSIHVKYHKNFEKNTTCGWQKKWNTGDVVFSTLFKLNPIGRNAYERNVLIMFKRL